MSRLRLSAPAPQRETIKFESDAGGSAEVVIFARNRACLDEARNLVSAAPDMLETLHTARPALIDAGALIALAVVDLAIAKAEGREG